MARSAFSYGLVPSVKLRRSVFDLSFDHKTTMNAADLVPVFCKEVVPGDTFSGSATFVARTSSPLVRPVMDNFFMDIYFFYVPNRIIDKNWENMFGYNSSGPWVPAQPVKVPSVSPEITNPTGMKDLFTQSLADYFGDIVPGMSYFSTGELTPVSQYPYRVYAKVYNDWVLSETTGTPVVVEPSNGSLNGRAFAPNNIFGKPAKIYKTHDRFTSALPAPQRGDPVSIPLSGNAPISGVVPVTNNLSGSYGNGFQPKVFINGSPSATGFGSLGFIASSGGPSYPMTFKASSDTSGSPVASRLDLVADFSRPGSTAEVDLSDVSAATINDLRFAFQMQRILERSAIYGARYTEYIQSAFGVHAGDSRLQRAEYLGGSRNPLSVQQVAQTMEGTGDNTLGQVGAFSLSSGRARFSKGIVEHGWIIGLAAIRQFHTYQQGIPRSHTRFDRFDFYDPSFAHLGYQPIYSYELFATAPKDQIFGYAEAYSDMRRSENMITGAFRSSMENGFDVWHFGDYYENAPVLNDAFLQETPLNIDDSLRVPAFDDAGKYTGVPQFLVDFWFDLKAIRPMPVNARPGMIDHF